jgi:hypothetical protein
LSVVGEKGKPVVGEKPVVHVFFFLPPKLLY